MRTGLHNLRLWEIEGCDQIYASVLCCTNSSRIGLFGVGGVVPRNPELHSAFQSSSDLEETPTWFFSVLTGPKLHFGLVAKGATAGQDLERFMIDI